jgi:hypothetical protein
MDNNRHTHQQLSGHFEVKETEFISLCAYEAHLEQVLCQAGRERLQQKLEELEEKNPLPITRCRWCGGFAHYDSNRGRYVNTHFGLIRYRRAYYICTQCQRSTCPLDERLNPYASLARLRQRIAAGKILPVDELASAWGLGSLKANPQGREINIAEDIVASMSEESIGR